MDDLPAEILARLIEERLGPALEAVGQAWAEECRREAADPRTLATFRLTGPTSGELSISTPPSVATEAVARVAARALAPPSSHGGRASMSPQSARARVRQQQARRKRLLRLGQAIAVAALQEQVPGYVARAWRSAAVRDAMDTALRA